MMLDVVFVSHEAERSGAPIALLHLLRWLRQATELSFGVVLGADGPLAEEFAHLAPVSLADDGTLQTVIEQARLVFANSTWSHALVDRIPQFDAPVVSHVHELQANLRPVNPLRAGKPPERYIVVSEQVQALLVNDYSIEPHRITICKPFIPVGEVTRLGQVHVDWQDFGLPLGARVVGAVGSLWPIKGPDQFLGVVQHLRQQSDTDDVHFVWVGGPASRIPNIQQQVAEAGLSDRVHLLGELGHPYDLIGSFDMFVLPSREDAFPLVILEAGALGRCIVAFDCGAGVREVLGNERGVLVPPRDVASMARQVAALLSDDRRRQALGADVAGYVAERHDVTTGAPGILTVIESVLRPESGSVP